MADQFSNSADQVSAPATRAVSVAPDDGNALAEIPKALFVGTGGNLVLCGVGGGSDTVWKNVPDGSIVPLRVQYVRATGTSAADILALY